MEETDHRSHEDEQVGHAEVGTAPTDPLQEQRARKHDHGQQDWVGHEDPEDEDDAAQPRASRSFPTAATPTMAATTDDCHPGDRRSDRQSGRPRPFGPRGTERCSPYLGIWLMGMVGCSLIGPLTRIG